MSNNKERYLAFAHTGPSFVTDVCTLLHIERAFGTTLPCGMHLTHLQLEAKHGKRASAVGNVVGEYNEKNAGRHLVLSKYEDAEGVVHFKQTEIMKNAIVKRISDDLYAKVGAAWSFPDAVDDVVFLGAGGKKTSVRDGDAVSKKMKTAAAKDPAIAKAAKAAKTASKVAATSGPISAILIKKILLTISEDLCRISLMRMQAASNDISDLFEEAYGHSAVYSDEYLDFVTEHVKSIFRTDLHYSCENVQKGVNPRVPDSLWDVTGGQDVVHKGKTLLQKQVFAVRAATTAPDPSTMNFFATHLPKWSAMLMADGVTPVESVDFTAAQFLFHLNGNQATGVYTSSCVDPFFSALVNAGAIVRNSSSAQGRCRTFTAKLAALRAFLDSNM